MRLSNWVKFFSLTALATAFVLGAAASTLAYGEYLVGDRTLASVLRYDENGNFLGVLLTDPTLGVGTDQNVSGLSAMTLSPDQSKLYVSDRIHNRIAVYNYTGTSASFAFDIGYPNAAPSTLYSPAGTIFSQDGSKLYVANLGPYNQFFLPAGDTVGVLTPTGFSAGPDRTGGPPVGRSSLAFAPNGDLLVTALALFGQGGVLRYDSGTNQFVDLVTPRPELNGAAAILTVGNDLYVAASYGGRVGKFNATTGVLDTSFGAGGYVSGNPNYVFPASLALGPDGNNILVGFLGATTGDSYIMKLDFNGNLSGPWASNTHATNFPPAGTGTVPSANILGFSEPTAIVHSSVIPEPATAIFVVLSIFAAAAMRQR
jgi:hypothetical protein